MRVLDNFYRFCEKEGVSLLKGDKDHIFNCINKMHTSRHRDALSAYMKIWVGELEKEENAALSQNLGRRQANLYLLDCAEYKK